MINKSPFITSHQALIKAQKYCAYQERCQEQVREKLQEWRINKEDAENIITSLINENFLNEERFARAYARGKFRIKKWGRIKINAALKQLNISPYCIRQAMKEINTEEYVNTLRMLIKKSITKKITMLSVPEKYTLAKKLMAKGYEQDIVWDIFNSENKK